MPDGFSDVGAFQIDLTHSDCCLLKSVFRLFFYAFLTLLLAFFPVGKQNVKMSSLNRQLTSPGTSPGFFIPHYVL